MAPSPHGNDSATPSRAVQTSSDHSTASTPLASERLRANPDAQAYLVTGAGQYLLVTLEEVAYYFSLGFDVRDHQTGLPVNVGVVPFSEYASEGSPFARQNMEEAAAREELRAASQDGVGDGGEVQKAEGQQPGGGKAGGGTDGFINVSKNGYRNGGAGGASGSAA